MTLSGVGSISGTNKLIKTGSGTLTINNTNLYSGGTIISNSTVLPGNIGANGAAWGSGPITLAGGGILQFNGYAGALGTGWGGCVNPIIVPSGQTGTLRLPPRWGYSSPFTSSLTGSGTLNVTIDYVRDYFSGNWSAFTGQINFTARSGTADFRIDNTAGYANAAIFLNNGVNICTISMPTTRPPTLANSAAPARHSSARGVLSIQRGESAQRTRLIPTPGVIADAGVTSLIKTGTGMLILSGNNNTYSGTTIVNGGILKVINTDGSATGSGSVNVTNGGALAGNGLISGAVAINSGGALIPGNPLGTLTFSNNPDACRRQHHLHPNPALTAHQ